FTLAQQPVIHEHTGQLAADRPLYQGSGYRRVDTTRQPADHPLIADGLADPAGLLVDDRRTRPVLPASGELDEETFEHGLPVIALHDSWMPLDSGQAPRLILKRRDRWPGGGCDAAPGR